ncbi:hypothetical protein IAI18_05280 [Acetobacteraceae bacterium H6797]|nr:hypothetical protein [Acetobacteraceae bacterium H6797]
MWSPEPSAIREAGFADLPLGLARKAHEEAMLAEFNLSMSVAMRPGEPSRADLEAVAAALLTKWAATSRLRAVEATHEGDKQ